MGYSLAVILDKKRLEGIRGTDLESKVTDMFGGAIQALIMDVPEERYDMRILAVVPGARIDGRIFLEEVPVAFKKAVYEEIRRLKSMGPEVLDAVFEKMAEIKQLAAQEQEYLPPPEVD
ncbi:MAG: hypothetical protein H5T97_11715 [Firmicutes bacterium]|nr:hypothetical protein [Bacillota bacterium]